MKKHYGKYPCGMNYYAACGILGNALYMSNKATHIKSKVTCKNCLRTKIFRKGQK